MSTKNQMKLWRCPKCKEEIKALALQVSHKCKSNKNLSTNWELVEEK
jgi:hypothetical protein